MHVSHLYMYHTPTCITNCTPPLELWLEYGRYIKFVFEEWGNFQVEKHLGSLKLYTIRVEPGVDVCTTLSQKRLVYSLERHIVSNEKKHSHTHTPILAVFTTFACAACRRIYSEQYSCQVQISCWPVLCNLGTYNHLHPCSKQLSSLCSNGRIFSRIWTRCTRQHRTVQRQILRKPRRENQTQMVKRPDQLVLKNEHRIPGLKRNLRIAKHLYQAKLKRALLAL